MKVEKSPRDVCEDGPMDVHDHVEGEQVGRVLEGRGEDAKGFVEAHRAEGLRMQFKRVDGSLTRSDGICSS